MRVEQLVLDECKKLFVENKELCEKHKIVSQEYRGQGYGYEMIHLAKKYAFEIANLCKIRLAVFDMNESAVKCYQRNGFVVVEHQENVFTFNGTSMGRYIMETYREE